MITYVFPGQGSQHRKMGSTLFDEFEALTTQADDILGYSIKQLCLEDPYTQLNQTQFTQPALYVVNALTYLKKNRDCGKKPDFVAGHSLGEYNALMAAGAFNFEVGLKLVKKRGALMSLVTNGGMAAVIGLNEVQVVEVLESHRLGMIDIANCNAPTQIVISGRKEDIHRAKEIFEAVKGVKMFSILNVSGAFHSRYMREARQEFEKYLSLFDFHALSIPVISNVYARPYELERLPEILAEQITSSIKWMDSMCFLMAKGDMAFEEIGPGKVLSKLVQKNTNEGEAVIALYRENQQVEARALEMERHAKVKSENMHTQVDGRKTQSAVTTSREEASTPLTIVASNLGSSEFRADYNLDYAYLVGGMYRGIASQELVIKLAQAGMMGFFGTGGLALHQIEDGIKYIQRHILSGQSYGVNIVYNLKHPELESRTIDLLLEAGVRNLEAASFLTVTPALIRFHAQGLRLNAHGDVITRQKIIVKLSRPEVAEAFLSPAPEHMLQRLLAENKITLEEAELSKKIPVADDICVEADSAGHTDSGVAYTLIPTMLRLRDEMMAKYHYAKQVRVGAAGGIGTPEAAMAAFMIGADFILTGSINQCTVEAGTSAKVKDLLQQMNVQDTDYAPAGDMFEMGSKIQVLRKGVFFPARANKLHELYRRYNSLDEIDQVTLTQLQEKYFKRSIGSIYEEVKSHHQAKEIEKAEKNPKHKMALIFRWYFSYSTQLALSGSEESIVDYQIHCGPALGAFNQWVKGTDQERWENRHVDAIGKKLMIATAELLSAKFRSFSCLQSKGK